MKGKKKNKLTPGRFLELAHRHLIVRVAIRNLPISTGYPQGRLETQIQTCSFHRDEHTHEVLLHLRWTYHEPCSNWKEVLELEVDNLMSVLGSDMVLKAVDRVLEEWGSIAPNWLSVSPHAAFVKRGGKVSGISMQEVHVLQHLARLQTAVAALVERGHTHQYYLNDLVYWLGAFIERQNREIERSSGLIVRTPAK